MRAIEHGLRFGAHGLPLMGGGDWNDGMNRVGEHGRGESVWLGFFLLRRARRSSPPLARGRGDAAFAERCDDRGRDAARPTSRSTAGTASGTAARTSTTARRWARRQNAECQIDSIAQSWSVLSGAGEPERARLAMDSLDRRLVRRESALVLLLDPPFDRSGLDPGYIKGYVPGVRENGGQYTHAAVWAVMASRARGRRRRAPGSCSP